MEQLMQSFGVMLFGMLGIFLVMGLISTAVMLLNKYFK